MGRFSWQEAIEQIFYEKLQTCSLCIHRLLQDVGVHFLNPLNRQEQNNLSVAFLHEKETRQNKRKIKDETEMRFFQLPE